MGYMINTAVIGPLLDAGSYFVPSMVGSKGRARARNKEEYKENPKELAHHLLIPGSFGYHQGLRHGHRDETIQMQKEMNKKARLAIDPHTYEKRYNDWHQDVNSEESINKLNQGLARHAKKVHKKQLGDLSDKEWGQSYEHAMKSKHFANLHKKHFGQY